MVHGKNRIPYWIDRRLTGLAGPDYDATISFGLPFELGDCPYGKSRFTRFSPDRVGAAPSQCRCVWASCHDAKKASTFLMNQDRIDNLESLSLSYWARLMSWDVGCSGSSSSKPVHLGW